MAQSQKPELLRRGAADGAAFRGGDAGGDAVVGVAGGNTGAASAWAKAVAVA